jgi:flagellar L-ring protein precursor FlgH
MKKRIYISILIVFLFSSVSVQTSDATSLWSGETIQSSSLFVDAPPPVLRENDIVVILIEEETSALADADTEAEIDDSVSGEISNWFSIQNAKDLFKLLTFASPDIKTEQNDSDNLPKWGFEISNEFEGEAETTRNNTVSASIAARVMAVKPNGNIVLEGKRHIKVNAETTILTVTGIARQQDVTEENTIPSYLISELHVSVDGKGIASNANRRGIVSHIMNLIR